MLDLGFCCAAWWSLAAALCDGNGAAAAAPRDVAPSYAARKKTCSCRKKSKW